VIGNVIGVLFDGLAYGSLLFIIAVGLSVTLGLMNFVNLAHGAFAMVGGYVCTVMMTRLGAPFLLTLPVAFIVAAIVGVILERTLYQRLYKSSHLDQVLFSIGLVFMSIAIATALLRRVTAAGVVAFVLRAWQVHSRGSTSASTGSS
jgi:branched-chain amino acid transport system permease protein